MRTEKFNSKSAPKSLCVDKRMQFKDMNCYSQLNVCCHLAPPRHILLEDTLRKQIIYKSDLCIWFVQRKTGTVKIQKKTFF